jgi:hypothetical protein
LTVPVFDSRSEPDQYHVSSSVDGETIEFMRSIPDPFVHHRLTIRPTWAGRLRVLLGRPVMVEVSIGGSRKVVEAVLELDGNYRGTPGSARRAEADVDLRAALRDF